MEGPHLRRGKWLKVCGPSPDEQAPKNPGTAPLVGEDL